MKKILSLLCTTLMVVTVNAGITTYTFNSITWGSTQGITPTTPTVDGWVCDSAAYGYDAGRTWADGSLHGCGVSVKTSTSGAGATSAVSFNNVSRITLNYCQNASKGQGVVYFQIGTADPDSIVFTRPASSTGDLNRDTAITYATPLSGNIRFWVKCTENSIVVNTLTIFSFDSSDPVFTQSTFQLVTDVTELKDSDQIIIGVADGTSTRIMGYYDVDVSQNNIHAIAGTYSDDRTTVKSNENAIYTLHTDTTDKGELVYILKDEIRYDSAYLVCDGGKTKNKLTAWDTYTSSQYGEFGLWNIAVAPNGAATIENRGTSDGKYISYNADNDLFACYAFLGKYLPVCIYREVAPIGTENPAIVAHNVIFPEVALSATPLVGSREITVNAINLTGDIQVSLAKGDFFTISTNTIDRNGGYLTVSYSATAAGTYRDSIYFTSPDTTIGISVYASIVPLSTVAEAVRMDDYTSVRLGEVVVTKKYDDYVFVRDETGSMLIYGGTGTDGKPLAQGLTNGDVLTGVYGTFQNYYGLPELLPAGAWKVGQNVECLPDSNITSLDSADVCRYVRLNSVTIKTSAITLTGITYALEDKFGIGLTESVECNLDVIVMYSYDALILWPVAQEIIPTPTALDETAAEKTTISHDVLGRQVGADYHGIVITDGKKKLVY